MDWEKIARRDESRSYLERVCWPYDKYPDMPQLTAGSEIVLLDADGPGVVTNLHSSKMDCLDGVLGTVSACEPDAYARVMIEVTYDHREKPDISMPLCAFLADPGGNCDHYAVRYFSKVREAHNFRLPMPFREHIRIVLKNPTQTDLIGYTDLQWKRLAHVPENAGYLYADYRSGVLRIPEQVGTLSDIQGNGTVRAHWFGIACESPLAQKGEYVCEGNQEFYIDGEATPSLEYLGSEDVYSHSWGMGCTGGDTDAAIIRMTHPTPQRTEIAMLRCREEDSIGFRKSMKILLDYREDYFAKDGKNPLLKKGVFADRPRVSFDMEFEHCVYYYR